MKLSKRDVGLLLILLAIAIVLVCYFAVFTPTREKSVLLRGEIASLEPVLAELKAKEANKDAYEEGIATSKANIQAIKEKYPASVRQEDLIMYTISLEEVVGLDTKGIGFAGTDLLETLDPVFENGELVYDSTYFYKTGINLSSDLSYQQVKDLVGYIYIDSIKTTLDSINLSYNAENGYLLGNINLSKYYLSTDSDPYIETYVPQMPMGQPNPFGSLSDMPEIEDEDE